VREPGCPTQLPEKRIGVGLNMPFNFLSTNIPGLMLIEPHVFLDERGCYKKYYEKDVFAEHGITGMFTESSEILSHKGVIRGLHYQLSFPQAKLLHVITGAIFDVALDLRPDSPTFGKWEAFYLSSNDPKLLYIPEGFAHGFLTLTDGTLFSYQCTGKYDPAAASGIVWDDPTLKIPWPISKVGKVIVSDKDRDLPTFAEFKQQLGQREKLPNN